MASKTLSGRHTSITTVSKSCAYDLRTAKLIRVMPDDLLHRQSGIARPAPRDFVGQRRVEERHDPVAHHLIHRAPVAMNGFHHQLEYWIEQLSRILGVAVGEQPSRARSATVGTGDELRS
jgi:hypothetical protein